MNLDLFVSGKKPCMLCCDGGFGWMQPAFSEKKTAQRFRDASMKEG